MFAARCALVAAALLLPAAALPAQMLDIDPPVKPIVLTVSGGASRGAYQAGVNWSIIEIMRRLRDDATFRAAAASSNVLWLSAAAGSSSGNVNSILSSLEWCKYTPQLPATDAERAVQGPDSSVFWKVWVHTGLEQLFPYRRVKITEDVGLFHRDFNRLFHYPTLNRVRMGGGFREGCDVALGLTLTKLDPERTTLGTGRNNVQPQTQRFATVFRVQELQQTLRFRQMPRAIFEDKRFGKLVAPRSERDGLIEAQHIFAMAEASSAFPVAFAPVRLSFYRAEQLAEHGGCDYRAGSCPPPEEDVFVDGGVFDNNPLHLSIMLFNSIRDYSRGDRALSNVLPASREVTPDIIYINPENTRPPADAFEHVHAAVSNTRGIGALQQLIEGFIPAAREYELQAMSRMMHGSEELDWVRTNDRSQPIFGNQLSGFGAFVGRPLREYDFYAGVYDGLDFMARTYTGCRRPELAAPPSHVDCAVTHLDRWISQLAFNDAARALLTTFRNAEHGDRPAWSAPLTKASNDAPTGELEQTTFVYQRLFRAQQALRDFDTDVECKGKSTIERILCSGGLLQVFEQMRNDRVLMTILKDRARAPLCKTPRYARPDSAAQAAVAAWAQCQVEPFFIELVEHPAGASAKFGSRLLHQLWRVENELDIAGLSDQEQSVEFAQMIYEGAAGRFRHGYNPDPSSILDQAAWWMWPTHLLPNYAVFNFGKKGLEAGYRPTLQRESGWGLIVPAFGAYLPLHDGSRGFYPYAGIAVEKKFHNVLVSSVSVGLDAFVPVNTVASDPQVLASSSFALHLLSDKVRLAGRVLATDESDIFGGRNWSFSAGLSDFNGLVFWSLRQFGACRSC
ncbi:MAG TPA: patatin-like phospholipase family protein [Longimicrobiales bacterium]